VAVTIPVTKYQHFGPQHISLTRFCPAPIRRGSQITMHLSPHEQKILIPWLKTFPKKTVDRFPTYLWPISALGLVYVTIVWTEAEDFQEDYAHRF
jgi:hypothetical protein